MADIAVQIGHVNGQAGAAHEEETLLKIFPHVLNRLRCAGCKLTAYDGSLQYESGNWQHDHDGAVFLHCDSGGTGSTGFSIGYWDEVHPGSSKLAAVLKDTYGKASGLKFIGYNITVGEWHYYANRRFSHRCKCTLIEFGFVSNPAERAFLQANAQKLGYAVADAYTAFFGGQPQPEPIPKRREDEMLYQGQGKTFVFDDCYVDRYDYYLHTTGSSPSLVFTLIDHATETAKSTAPQPLDGHHTHDLQAIAAFPATKTAGSYSLICKSDTEIRWALREKAK